MPETFCGNLVDQGLILFTHYSVHLPGIKLMVKLIKMSKK